MQRFEADDAVIRQKDAERQEMPQWENFADAHLDENSERRAPTPEQREKMDARLEALGKLFAGSDIKWMLDGAMNISLHGGEYIGMHKDTDISIEVSDWEKAEALLARHGYAFFHSAEQNGKMMLARAHAGDVPRHGESLMFTSVEATGRLRDADADPLNYVDVHLIKRGKNDELISPSSMDIPLPKAWAEPQPVDFHGTTINLSHPGRVAFFKIETGRAYDITDLRSLAQTGKLKEKDLADIEHIFNEEYEKTRELVRSVLQNILHGLPENASAETIFEKFMDQSAVAERTKTSEGKEALRSFSEYIAGAKDRSVESLFSASLGMFGIDKQRLQKSAAFGKVRGWLRKDGE